MLIENTITQRINLYLISSFEGEPSLIIQNKCLRIESEFICMCYQDLTWKGLPCSTLIPSLVLFNKLWTVNWVLRLLQLMRVGHKLYFIYFCIFRLARPVFLKYCLTRVPITCKSRGHKMDTRALDNWDHLWTNIEPKMLIENMITQRIN